MLDLTKTRKFKNRKKWVATASVMAATIGLVATTSENVSAAKVGNETDAENDNESSATLNVKNKTVTSKTGLNYVDKNKENENSSLNNSETNQKDTNSLQSNQINSNNVQNEKTLKVVDRSANNENSSAEINNTVNQKPVQTDDNLSQKPNAENSDKNSSTSDNETLNVNLHQLSKPISADELRVQKDVNDENYAHAYIKIYQSPTGISTTTNSKKFGDGQGEDNNFTFDGINTIVGGIDLSDGKNEATESNATKDVQGSVSGHKVTITLPKGWTWDQDFTKLMDPDRFNKTDDHDLIISPNGTDSTGRSILTFNFKALPKDTTGKNLEGGRLNNQAYQIFVKKVGKSYPVVNENYLKTKGIIKDHATTSILNWYDDRTGSYLGSTAFYDYSVGLAGRREDYYKQLYDVKSEDSEFENTSYHFKLNGDNWVFAYDDNEYGNGTNDRKPDGKPGKKGSVFADDGLKSGKFDADFEDSNPYYFNPSIVGYNGKEFHIFRMFLSQVPKLNKKYTITISQNDSLNSEEKENIKKLYISNYDSLPADAEIKITINGGTSRIGSTTADLDITYPVDTSSILNHPYQLHTSIPVNVISTTEHDKLIQNIQFKSNFETSVNKMPSAMDLVKNIDTMPVDVGYVWGIHPVVSTSGLTSGRVDLIDLKTSEHRLISGTQPPIPIKVVDSDKENSTEPVLGVTIDSKRGYTDSNHVPYFVEFYVLKKASPYSDENTSDAKDYKQWADKWQSQHPGQALPHGGSWYLHTIKSVEGKLGTTVNDLREKISLPKGYIYSYYWIPLKNDPTGVFKASPKIPNSHFFNPEENYEYVPSTNKSQDTGNGYLVVYITKAKSDNSLSKSVPIIRNDVATGNKDRNLGSLELNGNEVSLGDLTLGDNPKQHNPLWTQVKLSNGELTTKDLKDIKDLEKPTYNWDRKSIYTTIGLPEGLSGFSVIVNPGSPNSKTIDFKDLKNLSEGIKFDKNANALQFPSSFFDKFNTADFKIRVYYSDQQITYQFVDDNDSGAKVGSPAIVKGKTDQTVDTGLSVPAGYQLAKGQSLPNSVSMVVSNKDLGQTVTIHLVHGSKKINPGNVINKGTDPTKGEPNVDVKKTDSQHTLKRVITVTNPDGTTHTETQSIDFQRTGHIDTVNGNVSWDAWKPADNTQDSFAEYDAPTIAGYTPDKKAEAETKVSYSDGQADETVTINYTAGKQQIIYTFVDDDSNEAKVGSSVIIKGNTNDNKPTRLVMPNGYKLSTGKNSNKDIYYLPKNCKFGPTSATVNIHLKHVISPVIGPKRLPKSSDLIPGTNNKYPINVTKLGNFNSSVKRTIDIKKPHEKEKIIHQEVDFTRTATVDAVTGKISYTKWVPDTKSGDELAEVDAPDVDGYTKSTDKADRIDNVQQGEKVKNVTIIYTAEDQNVTLRFWDNTENKEIGNDHVLSGKTDQTIDTDLTAPAGYDLVSGNTIPTKYTFKASGNDAVTIHFAHHIDNNVTKTPAGGAKNPDGSDVKDGDFSKTVKRTIIAHIPAINGVAAHDKDSSQTAIFTRTGNYDEVTKQMSWQPWSSTIKKFEAVNVPEVDGYTPLVNGAKNAANKLGSVQVTANTPNQTINITYVSNKSDVVKYNPKARKDYQVAAGTKINKGSNATNMITNMKDLPQNTTVVWDQVPDTSNSSYTDKKPSAGTLTVTYPDKTSVEVPVVITVLPSVRPVQPVQPSEPIDIVPTEPEENKPATPATPANTVSTNNTSTINETVSNKHLVLTHNAFLYTRKGLIIRHKGKTIVWKRGRHITKYGKIVLIKGKKFYNVKRNAYVKVSNTLVYRKRIFKLTHNAFVYDAKGHAIRAKKHSLRLALRKKNTHVKAWNNGISVMIKGKAYYQIGKNAFIKVGNTIPKKASAYTER